MSLVMERLEPGRYVAAVTGDGHLFQILRKHVAGQDVWRIYECPIEQVYTRQWGRFDWLWRAPRCDYRTKRDAQRVLDEIATDRARNARRPRAGKT